MIQTIEECALNAWPARRQLLFDGWILRFADGYTKRANSINPMYGGSQDVQRKIERCIQTYQAQHLPPVFRITPLAQPHDLDDFLIERGFTLQSRTRVQTLNLTPFQTKETIGFHGRPDYAPAWLAHFSTLEGVSTPNKMHEAILRSIIPQKCFATLTISNQVVACGLAVLEGEYVGLFDIVTAAHQRGKGYGQGLMRNLLHWAKNNGATTAYLQVETDNKPALNLYAKLGFVERYQYWYRVQPQAIA